MAAVSGLNSLPKYKMVVQGAVSMLRDYTHVHKLTQIKVKG